MNSLILKTILRTLAAKAIPEIERRAIAWLLQNRGLLQGKMELAEEYAMEQYAALTANVPGLNTTKFDDEIVRAELRRALKQAWEHADEEIKQAARRVRESLPPASEAPVTDPLTYTDAPPAGVPAVVSGSLADQIPQD